MTPERFKVRTYAIIMNDEGKVLLFDEEYKGNKVCKLPGGGVELGEGIKEALVRELHEESGLSIDVTELTHLYTEPGLVLNHFNPRDQVIGVYYRLNLKKEISSALALRVPEIKRMRWLEPLKAQKELSFQMDVAALLRNKKRP